MTDDKDHVISQLRQQNSDLHNVIRQMREEIETIAEPSNQISASYVHYMEQELTELKLKNRELEVKVQSKQVSSDKPPRSPSVESKSHVISEDVHRSHVIALSDTIAALQRDKSGLECELAQCRTGMGRLEGALQEHKEKVRVSYFRGCSILL